MTPSIATHPVCYTDMYLMGHVTDPEASIDQARSRNLLASPEEVLEDFFGLALHSFWYNPADGSLQTMLPGDNPGDRRILTALHRSVFDEPAAPQDPQAFGAWLQAPKPARTPAIPEDLFRTFFRTRLARLYELERFNDHNDVEIYKRRRAGDRPRPAKPTAEPLPV